MKREKTFWLVTTGQLENRIWFRDEKDFKVGMNYVAVQAAGCEAFVLAFILMSNHVHFVMCGYYEDALTFITDFKTRYSKYFAHKYGQKELLRRNRVDIRALSLEDEGAERAIAYVHMNCVAANICASASQYPWGSGAYLFNPTKPDGIRLGELSFREQKRQLHSSSQDLPHEWILCKDGYILPSSYLAVKMVESIFRTPKRMNYFLQTSSKARKKLETGETHAPSFRDQIVAAAIPDLCRTLFGVASAQVSSGGKGFIQPGPLQALSPEQLAELLRQLRFRFSANVNQLARVTGLSYSDVAGLLDQV